MKRLSFLTFGDGRAGGANAAGAGGVNAAGADDAGGGASGSCTFEPVDFNHFFCVRRPRAVVSLGSSFTTNAECDESRKDRSPRPIAEVAFSIAPSVCSVCIRSLAKACHSAKRYKSIRSFVLCGSGRSPSAAGIMFY